MVCLPVSSLDNVWILVGRLLGHRLLHSLRRTTEVRWAMAQQRMIKTALDVAMMAKSWLTLLRTTVLWWLRSPERLGSWQPVPSPV